MEARIGTPRPAGGEAVIKIQKTTATVFIGGNGKRFFTKKAAARSLAKQAYRQRYQLYRCSCSRDEGMCDWCSDAERREKVVARYARMILRRPVEEVRG